MGQCQLLVEKELLHRRPSSAAILLGPIDRYPAFLVEIFLPAPERTALARRAHCVSLRELPGQFFRNEPTDFRTEGFVLFRKLDIHLLTFRGNDPGVYIFIIMNLSERAKTELSPAFKD